MIFRQLFDKESSTYTYILADEDTLEAVIIDAVAEQIDRDLKLIEELGLKLTHAVETHVHADHITACGKIKQKTGCKLAYGANSGVKTADLLVKEGDKIPFGKHFLRVVETPGHTNGCTTYVTEDNKRAFTGDALLIRGCGRTDFQGGSAETLFASISKLYNTLPGDCMVFPGHDYKGHLHSTIAEEKKYNPRLFEGQTVEGFVRLMNGLNLPRPVKIDTAVPANLECGLSQAEEAGKQ